MISHLLARLCPLLLLSLSVFADTPPPIKTWELGLGVGAVAGPDYRGSRESRTYVAPIPYFIYRGKFIQSDREGVRGQFLSTDSYELTLSLSANVTPDSDKNSLRATHGLGRLGSTLEIGPALNINLSGPHLSEGWLLSLPVRGVVAIGGDDSGYMGYVVQPQLIYRQRWNDIGFAFRSSVTYADKRYHRYYYEVGEADASVEFPAYRAQAGYSGWANQASVSHTLGDWRLGLFVRHDYLGGVDFLDSPLVETRNSVRGGIAIIWVMR